MAPYACQLLQCTAGPVFLRGAVNVQRPSPCHRLTVHHDRTQSVIGCYTEHLPFEEPTQDSLAILRTTEMSQLCYPNWYNHCARSANSHSYAMQRTMMSDGAIVWNAWNHPSVHVVLCCSMPSLSVSSTPVDSCCLPSNCQQHAATDCLIA